jgi:hypothetical protein
VAGGLADWHIDQARIARSVNHDPLGSRDDHRQEWEAVWFPVTERLDPAAAIAVDHDDRDLRVSAPDGVGYRIPDAAIDTKTWWREVARDLADHLRRDARITVWRDPELKLYARVDETRDAFLARCDAAAQAAADAELLAGAGQLLSVVLGGSRSTRSTVTGLGRALGRMASRRGTVSRTTQRRVAAEEPPRRVRAGRRDRRSGRAGRRPRAPP